MGIEKLKSSLIKEANDEAEKLIIAAELQVKNLLNDEKSQANAEKAQVEKEISVILNERKGERLAWARLEAKRIIAEAKEDVIKASMDTFFEKLIDSKKGQNYKKALKKAIENAVMNFGKNVVIHLLKDDKDLAPKGKNVSIETDLEGLGGAIIESEDGKIRINLTLETLVETKREEIRKKLIKVRPS